MTGYSIRRGYNSSHSAEDVEERLRIVVKAICSEPERITENAAMVEGTVVPSEYEYSYREPWGDLSIAFMQDHDDRLCVRQLASGCGKEREFKEAMRRAMCRLVMAEMHRSGMEVSISVD